MLYSDALDLSIASSQALAPQKGSLETLGEGVVATGLDIASTMVRSVTFGQVDVTTEDLISGLGMDSTMQTYLQYRDTIETASLIGGTLLPGVMAIKAVNAARAGMRGANWFSTAGRRTQLAEASKLLQEGAKKTAEYNVLRRKIYRDAIANGMVDNAAAELAIIGTMNAHPMMEDYMEDLPTSAAFSLVVGGSIGAVVDVAATRYMFKGLTGEVKEQAVKPVLKELAKPLDVQGAQLLDYSVGQMVSQRLKAIEESTEVVQLTREFARDMRTRIEVEANDYLKKGLDTAVYNDEAVRASVQEMLKDPAALGASKIKFASFANDKPNMFTKAASKIAGVLKQGDEGLETQGTVGYSPIFKSYIGSEDMERLATAADVGGWKEMQSRVKAFHHSRAYLSPRPAELENLLGSSAADQDMYNLALLKYYDELPTAQLAKTNLHESDVGTIRAVSRAFAERKAKLEIKLGTEAGDLEKLAKVQEELKLIDDAKITVKTKNDDKLIPVSDLAAMQKERTIDSVLDMAKSDVLSVEEIVIRTGLMPESVENIIGATNRMQAKELPLQYRLEVDEAETLGSLIKDKHLVNTNRMLAISANKNMPKYSEYMSLIKSEADTRHLDDWAERYTFHELEMSESSLVRGTFESGLFSKADIDLAVGDLGKVSQELAGSRFVNSLDMYKRRMGDAGRVLSSVGDRVTVYANKMVEDNVGPVRDLMEQVSRSEPDVLLFNQAVEVYRSLSTKGSKIRYQDRKFQYTTGRKLEDGTPEWVTAKWDGKDFIVPESASNVDKLLHQVGDVGRTVQSSSMSRAKIKGSNVSDIGYWMPNFNPRGKLVYFTVDHTDPHNPVHQIVWGQSKDEVQRKLAMLHSKASREGRKLESVSPEQKEMYAKLRNAAYQGKLTEADVGSAKQGHTSSTLINGTTETLSDVAEGLSNRIISEVHATTGLAMDRVVRQLDKVAAYEQSHVTNQALTPLAKDLMRAPSPAQMMKAAMFGKSGISEYSTWGHINSGFDSALSIAVDKVNKLMTPLRAGKDLLGKSNTQKFADLSKQLEEAGYPNPYLAFGDDASEALALARKQHPTVEGRRAVAAVNGLAATFALRFMELAQPLVNAVSMPILSYSAAAHKYDDVFMGVRKQQANVNPVEVMHSGVRMMSDPDYEDLFKHWEGQGYLDSVVSEATKVLRMAHVQEPGFIAATERFLDSKVIEKLSTPSDVTESLTRKAAMGMGAYLGKKLYGFDHTTDEGKRALTIFARDFMDRAIGNYTSSQRPVFFQGTLGTALGLFQTYVLTMAQNMYRHLEVKDYKAMGGTMLMQSSIFGVGSLPGFDMLSHHIGEHYSDNHKDLTSGLYQAIPDQSVANSVLYGLPSTLGGLLGVEGGGMGLSGRGDMALRFPTGLDSIAGVNMVGQGVQGMYRVATSMAAKDENAGRAMLEAISLQSVSRPMARMSELVMGYSLNQQETVVSTPDEVWTPMSIAARMFATRPTEEVRKREAEHLNSIYGALDRENRAKAVRKLKTAFREDGVVDNTVLLESAEEYLRSGTPQGFRSAMQQAMYRTEMGIDYDALNTIGPQSPLWNMVNDL